MDSAPSEIDKDCRTDTRFFTIVDRSTLLLHRTQGSAFTVSKLKIGFSVVEITCMFEYVLESEKVTAFAFDISKQVVMLMTKSSTQIEGQPKSARKKFTLKLLALDISVGDNEEEAGDLLCSVRVED